MSARNCPSCHKQARKWKIVLLLGNSGALKGSKVCSACASDGVTVVAPKLAPVVQTGLAERKNQKEVLAPFIQNLKAKIAARAMTEPSLLIHHEDLDRLHHVGYTQALVDVLAMLKEGRA